MPDESPLATDLPDEEALVVEDIGPHWAGRFISMGHPSELLERVEAHQRYEPGPVFLTPQNGTLYHSFSLLKQGCSNNEAEYEALIMGLTMALDMGILFLYVFGD